MASRTHCYDLTHVTDAEKTCEILGFRSQPRFHTAAPPHADLSFTQWWFSEDPPYTKYLCLHRFGSVLPVVMLGPARPFTVTHVITNVTTLDRSAILNYGYGFHVTIRLRGLTLYSDVPYPRLSARCRHSCFELPPPRSLSVCAILL